MTQPSPTEPVELSKRPLGATTGALLIVANMIGVGVFITTGFMVSAIPSPGAILLAWILGGVVALCGALTYAELGAALPQNGGEYLLLSRIFHPAVGFAAGWVSLIVGFSAPLALFAMAFGTYLQAVVPSVPAVPAGLCLIAVFAAIHSAHVQAGSRFHNVFTLGKIGLILLFIVAGLFQGGTNPLSEASKATLREHVFAPAFAVQLVYVSFAYAGWNTAGYLAGEFRNPQQDMPRAVIAGVSVVVLLYLGLNVVFLISAPLNELAGQEKVGHVAATCLFGAQGGRIVSLLIVAGLISTVSANLMSGPRVYEAMGADYRWLRFLSCRRAGGGPLYSIALQAVLAAIMLVTASFEGLLTYIGVTLSLSAGATVLGALVLRYREPDLPRPYRTWGFPLTPLVFLALESWMIVFAVWKEPWTAACGAATIAAGLVVYGLLRFQGIRQSSSGDSR